MAAAARVRDLKSESDVEAKGAVVLAFWVEWAEPCAPLLAALPALSSAHPQLTFLRVHAEQQATLTEKYKFASVPAFAFLFDGAEVDRLEGASAAELRSKSARLAARVPTLVAISTPTPIAAPSSVLPPKERLEKLINQKQVMLFMKGTPDAPRCGFSRQMVELIRSAGATDFGAFDILADESVRTGLREYSNWPTYPQLYIKGKLIGGLDVAKQMHEDGDLAPLMKLEEANVEETLDQKLGKLVNRAPVMIFMKGTPETPKCGFSQQMIALLRGTSVSFDSFDILSDETVRNGLKAYSNWPTYPQLYVKGKLIGGLDVTKQMQEDGELAAVLQGE